MSSDLVIGMAGSGGDGIVSAGDALMTAAALEGYRAAHEELRPADPRRRVLVPPADLDAAGAELGRHARRRRRAQLGRLPASSAPSCRSAADTIVIYDAATGVAPDELPLAGRRAARGDRRADRARWRRRTAGTDKAKNIVVLGLLAGWFGIGREALLDGHPQALRRRRARRCSRGTSGAFAAGHRRTPPSTRCASRARSRRPRPWPSAQAAGRRQRDVRARPRSSPAASSSAATRSRRPPRSCSSSAREIWKYGGTMLQAEDEIAGIGAVVGASFAGKKAMTATSGPGMSLKTEMLGPRHDRRAAARVRQRAARRPLDRHARPRASSRTCSRPCFSAHGDVLRPGARADLRGRHLRRSRSRRSTSPSSYQTPVIVLSDQEIAQRKETVDPIDTARVPGRRAAAADAARARGLRALPAHRVGRQPDQPPRACRAATTWPPGIEHNERGAPTASGEVHARMNEKRIRKLEPLQAAARPVPDRGRPARAARARRAGAASPASRARRWRSRAQEGIDVKLLVPQLLYPVAEEIYARVLRVGARAGSSWSSRTRGSSTGCCGCSSTCRAASSRSRAAGRTRSRRPRSSSGCASWRARCRAARWPTSSRQDSGASMTSVSVPRSSRTRPRTTRAI